MNEVMEILMDLRPDVDFEKEKALVDDEILDSFNIITIVIINPVLISLFEYCQKFSHC